MTVTPCMMARKGCYLNLHHFFNHFSAPALGEELMMCDECNSRFAESFLCSYFKLAVCDNCR